MQSSDSTSSPKKTFEFATPTKAEVEASTLWITQGGKRRRKWQLSKPSWAKYKPLRTLKVLSLSGSTQET